MSAIGLPAHILALFSAGHPIEYLKPPTTVGKKGERSFECSDYVYLLDRQSPANLITTSSVKKEVKTERRTEHDNRIREGILAYQARNEDELRQTAPRTVFVGRLAYETTERTLSREFSEFGEVEKVTLAYDRNGNPRGYGFILFKDAASARATVRKGDGKRIDGRRVIVDVEKGHSSSDWLPKRLGGGKGIRRGNNSISKRQ